MYKTKRIHYKVIFKQDGHSETVEYKSSGVVCYGENTHISFETKDGVIDFIYDKNNVTLKQGQSILLFDYHKEVWNDYQLPYGNVHLKTNLITFDAKEERIKMKYKLYDQSGIISTVYIFITLIDNYLQEAI